MALAPDTTTLLDFETNLEEQAKVFLSAATGLTATSVFATLDQDNFVLPRLSVMIEIGEASDPPTPKHSGSSSLEYFNYDARMSVMITSDASVDGTHTVHRQHRANVRKSMLLTSTNWDTTSTDQIQISGAGTGSGGNINGFYYKSDSISPSNGKNYYILAGGAGNNDAIKWTGSAWEITRHSGSTAWNSSEDTATPDLVSSWTVQAGGTAPPPTVAKASMTPFYVINYMRPMASTFGVQEDLAISTLVYNLNVNISDDAFPTS